MCVRDFAAGETARHRASLALDTMLPHMPRRRAAPQVAHEPLISEAMGGKGIDRALHLSPVPNLICVW